MLPLPVVTGTGHYVRTKGGRFRKKMPQSRSKPHQKPGCEADLTSTMMVATRRVGSTILCSCFIGPMRKMVLRADTHRPSEQDRAHWAPRPPRRPRTPRGSDGRYG